MSKETSPPAIGVIGCGIIADTHVEAILTSVPGAQVYVCDPLPGKAELLRHKYRLKGAYDDMTKMLAEIRPYSVHILSPPHLHIRHARQCLEAGAHVLVEKPLCFDAAEAEALFAFARSLGRTVCVDHSLLYQPSVVRMLDRLKAARIDYPLHIDSYYGLDTDEGLGSSLPSNHWKRTIPGGALMDSLVHPISLAVSLSGKPSGLSVHTLKVDGEEQMKALWKTDHTLVTVTVSQGAQPFRRATSVITTAFTAIVDHSTEVLAVQDKGFGPRSLKKVLNNVTLGWQLASGTVQTAYRFARKQILSNPGARALIQAYYRHLEGQGENPISEASVVNTTIALQQAADLIGSTAAANAASAPAAASTLNPAARRVLLTGASGFLGRNLVPRLLAGNNRIVLAQVRRGANADQLPGHPGLRKQYVDFDLVSRDQWPRLLEGMEDVVHCAHAAGSKTWEDYHRRNTEHSMALYEAAALAGCKRFIHISSLAVYGVGSRGSKPLNELDPMSNGGRWDYYVRSKKMAEEALLARAANGGPSLLILRPGILYSAQGERLFAKSIPTRKGRLFIVLGSGKNHLPYTRVDVLADLIVRVLDSDTFPTGVFNVTGEQSQSLEEFVGQRCEKLGVVPSFFHIPAFPFRWAAFGLESLYALTGRKSPPKLNRYNINSATRDLIYDCSKAKSTLGWDPAAAVAF